MTPGPRPRVEGEREAEILDAALVLLGRVGYDRLTMDAVAAEAKASKATLYRRWTTKPSLVVDATAARLGSLTASSAGPRGETGLSEQAPSPTSTTTTTCAFLITSPLALDGCPIREGAKLDTCR